MSAINYREPGPLKDLSRVHPSALESLPTTPVAICHLAHNLVVQPSDAQQLDLPSERFAENQIRQVDALLGALLALDPAGLDVARRPERRVIGTCRHFAVLSCALLRHRGFAARVRCGFATYFQLGQGLDHWITEYWHDDDGRWVRVDSELIDQSVLADPTDLVIGQFLSGGEAWSAFRAGRIDPAQFGVDGTQNWGPGEIRGNAVKDLAALNKVEMLPWDEWGRMDASYHDATGAAYDDLMDTIAAVCAADDSAAVADLYASQDLPVPAELLR